MLCGVVAPCYGGIDNKVPQLHRTKMEAFRIVKYMCCEQLNLNIYIQYFILNHLYKYNIYIDDLLYKPFI